jgi:hypothetical protein
MPSPTRKAGFFIHSRWMCTTCVEMGTLRRTVLLGKVVEVTEEAVPETV